MDRTNVLLLVVVVITALAVVGLRHESRLAFTHLQSLYAQRDELDIEWGKLLLEQGAWSQHQRVEDLAQKNLGMALPASKEVVMLDLRKRLVADATGDKH
jgi:cell division protein FtsL